MKLHLILFGALLSQIKRLMIKNLAAGLVAGLLNGAVPFKGEPGCEITMNHHPNAGKCWLRMVSWIFLRATMAGSQPQSEVKLVLTG